MATFIDEQPLISLDHINPSSPEDQTPLINLYDDKDTNWAPSMELSTLRAWKADYGLGALSPGQPTINNAFQTRTADLLRQSTADKQAIEQSMDKNNVIKELAKNAGTDPDAPQKIRDIAQISTSVDPDSVFEMSYASKFIQTLSFLKDPDSNPFTKAFAVDPNDTLDLMHVATNIVGLKEYAQRHAEDIENNQHKNTEKVRTGDQPFSDYVSGLWATGKSLIPLYSWGRFTDAISDLPIAKGLPGTRMEDVVARLYQLPPEQARAEFNTILDRIKDDPEGAKTFARAVASYSNSDKLLQNAFGVLDIAGTLPIGVGLKGVKAVKGVEGISGNAEIRNALKEAIKASADEPVKVSTTLDRMGDTQAASNLTFYERWKAQFEAKDPMGNAADLEGRLPTRFNPKNVTSDRVNLAREGADRLENMMGDIYGRAYQMLTNTLMVNRVPDEAIAAYIAEAANKIKSEFPNIQHGLLDMRHIPAEQDAANIHHIKYEFGRMDGQLLGADEVQYMAEEVYKFPRGSYQVEPQGMMYKLTVTKPIDETDPIIRGHLITTENTTPKTLLNTILGRVRTPEDTLSPFQRDARHVAVHASQDVFAYAKDVADRYVKPLSRTEKSRLEALLDHNHLEPGPNGLPGNWYATQGDYVRGYRSLHGVEPTERETAAYFATTSFSDVDYVMRNLNMHGDMSRMGVSHFRVSTLDENGHPTNSPWFFGKTVDKLPATSEHQAVIAVVEDGANKGWTTTKGGKKPVDLPNQSVQSLFLSRNMTTDQRAYIDDLLGQGYKIVQVANSREKPLRELTGSNETIHFAVLKQYEQKNLPWDLIDYRPGGHTDYSWQHWVKQANITRGSDGRRIYDGDKTLLSFNTETEARKYAERVTEAVRLNNLGDNAAFEAFVSKNLPKEIGTHIKAGIIDSENPITHLRSSQTVLDVPHMQSYRESLKGLEDQVNNPYNLFNDVDRKYTGHRDPNANTVAELGTDTNPLFALEQAKTFDTQSSIVRGLTGAIKSRYFDDYRTQAAESFAKEFGPYLAAKTGAINNDPIFHLYREPEWTTGTPANIKTAGELYRRNTLDLMGAATEKNQAFSQVKESLLNSIYKVGGQSWSNGAFVNDWMLPMVKDPGVYFRAVAFHSTMGLLNPVQWFTQIQTLTHVAAIAGPAQAAKGTTAGVLMRHLAMTDEANIVAHYAKIADKMGVMKAEEFIDSHKWLHKSGWYHVEGEHALVDDLINPKIFSNGKDTILHGGTYFFREGERLTRLAAWNAAYAEHIAAGGAELTNATATKVLGRARLMTGDMVRDATASWSRGIMSLPTQFLNYPARLAEQLMPFAGSRLTTMEKARAMGVYSAMYGVPVGLGASVGAWPMYDAIRSEAISRGFNDENSSAMTTALLEGLPSMMWTYITGSKTDWSQRMGPQGTQFFRDILKGDKTFREIAMGASGSIVGGMFSNFLPAFKALADTGLNKDGIKLFLEDFIEASRGISSINNIAKFGYVAATGKYIARSSQGPVTDMSLFDGFVSSFIGPTTRKVSDTYLAMNVLKEEKAAADAISKQGQKDIRSAVTAYSKNDMDTGTSYWNRAIALFNGANLNPQQITQGISRGLDNAKDLADKVDWDLVNKSRADRQQVRQKALEDKIKAKQVPQ